MFLPRFLYFVMDKCILLSRAKCNGSLKILICEENGDLSGITKKYSLGKDFPKHIDVSGYLEDPFHFIIFSCCKHIAKKIFCIINMFMYDSFS